ncbi:MAG: mannose-1-phosphate guanylyltransferase [Bryobacteraceae bacterium]
MSNNHTYGLILAGGRGTRFWPRSRTRTPKQLIPFTGTRSLLQDTVDRLSPILPPERLWILTNAYLRDEVQRQLPDVPEQQIIAEPDQRNTAPCLGLAAHLIQASDPEAVLGVFPADHHIGQPDRFLEFLPPAFAAAREGKLVTIGIQPRWPETGYGYLEFPAGATPGELQPYPLERFREKPDLATAQGFLSSGRFYWNAGMFFWRAAVFTEALHRYLSKTADLLASLPGHPGAEFDRMLGEVYPQCENVSVDYAVMEKAALDGKVAGIASDDFGWSDLGSWNAVYELLGSDGGGNAVRGSALLQDASGCFVEAGAGKLVALLGVNDLVVVDTPDALLITDRKRAQEVGRIVKMLEQQGRTELL